MKRTNYTRDGAVTGGLVGGIFAVLAAIAIAFGGWLLFNEKEDTPESVGNDVSEAFKMSSQRLMEPLILLATN